jgi:hypothetical protein
MFLKKCGLIQEISDSELLLNEVPMSIGKETDKAQLMRNKRFKDKKLIESSNNVTEALPPVTFCYTEIEKEIDIEKSIYMNLSFIDDSIEKVKLTQEQYDKLIDKFSKDLVHKTIISLDTYIANGTKKYKDHYRTLNNWCMKNNTNTQSTPNVNKQYDAFQFDD